MGFAERGFAKTTFGSTNLKVKAKQAMVMSLALSLAEFKDDIICESRVSAGTGPMRSANLVSTPSTRALISRAFSHEFQPCRSLTG